MANLREQEDLGPQNPAERRGSQEHFLNSLYARTVHKFLHTKGTKTLATFGRQTVEGWVPATAQPGGHPAFAADVQKAVLLRIPDQYLAFALTIGLRSKYDSERTLGMQFGTIPINEWYKKRFEKENVGLSDIRILFSQGTIANGSGEFYIDGRLGRLQMNCWADDFRYGGQNIKSWPENKLLSMDGVDASLVTIQRLVKNAFLKP